jgi:uncharacterized heparinase superfamily protein
VSDSVSGGGWPAVARYILHPDVDVELVTSNSFQVKLASGELILVKVNNGLGRLERASFAAEFGKVLPTQCIAVDLQNGNAQVRFSWS